VKRKPKRKADQENQRGGCKIQWWRPPRERKPTVDRAAYREEDKKPEKGKRGETSTNLKVKEGSARS